jgi:Ca2+-binding RTX toxin-like protein
MTTGTNRNDTLKAIARSEQLFGLDGHDLITSLFNKTKLFGQGGSDTLTVELERSETDHPVTLFSTLSGGGGRDTLNLTYKGTSAKHVTMQADLDGGNGNDTIVVDVTADGSTADVTSRILGGAGNDRIEIRGSALGWDYESGTEWSSRLTNWVDGGIGDDTITAIATARDGKADYATNVIFGGDGNDRIYAETNDTLIGGGADEYGTNEIDGGSGDDHIEAIASVNGNGGWHALNDISGGAGNDTIVATASAGSNDSAAIAENRIDGDDGNDIITMRTSAGLGLSTVRASVTGGDGNDTVISTAFGGDYGIDAKLGFEGGLGNDRIESSLTVDGYEVSRIEKVVNRLEGHDDNDTLIARLESRPAGEPYTPRINAVNRLDGGSGADVMESTILGLGRSIFNGGSGADLLKVDGGQNNLLSGGSGRDRLFVGSGTDKLIGGGAVDDFVFDVTKDQGSNRILDFEGDRDRLCFIGLDDEGPKGLTDDLDAISSIVDQGAGLDVLVTLDSGTEIVFEGCGLGEESYWNGDNYEYRPMIDSLADLVENPATQLLIEA